MANILQVTNPVNDNSRNAINTQTKNLSESQQLQNPVDPTRVVRADGQTGNKAGDAMSEAANIIVDYESNYGAFIKRLGEGQELPRLLEQLFQAENAAVLFSDEAAAPLLEQLFASMQMNSPEELLTFLQTQMEQQAKFSGPFFDGLRKLLSENRSDSAKEAVLSFLRSYNSMSSGEHTLKQMKALTEDIERLMFRQFKGEYQDILEDMDWEAPGGQTRANEMVLNQRLIPFLASYISKTHDYGPIRSAVMLFIFHAVQYEEGNQDRLMQLFDRLMRVRGFDQIFEKEEAYEEFARLTQTNTAKPEAGFADAFSKLVGKGADGAAGLENIQQFYNIMNGMLVNESVYLPLVHLLLPFRFEEEQVMSEMWVDPDAGSEESEGRRIKMLLKFDIRNLGRFDLVLTMENRQVGMQLYVPPSLADSSEHISRDVTNIFKKSGLKMGQLLIREKKSDLKVMDVFPEIREKERTINVRI
ncbi:MAG: hypothetical protein HFI67_06460 [Lachnospiraceae bacterium]|nr:hypothetical protein [Lachnospiraceae bacterium]